VSSDKKKPSRQEQVKKLGQRFAVYQAKLENAVSSKENGVYRFCATVKDGEIKKTQIFTEDSEEM
jgi:hypothetical protein